jgi:hypothetical protein
VNRQRQFLRDWLGRNIEHAVARREIAAHREAAFVAEGLA